MGIYDSGMSCWERRKLKLPQDHAGPGVIGEVVNDQKVVKKPVVEEPAPVVEEEEPKKTTSRKKSTSKLKKLLDKDEE